MTQRKERGCFRFRILLWPLKKKDFVFQFLASAFLNLVMHSLIILIKGASTGSRRLHPSYLR